MAISRRDFLLATAASAIPLGVRGQTADGAAGRVFRHGVASGDPLGDRVILWTRVDPGPGSSPREVRWRVGTDERFSRVVAAGVATAAPARDFTVKVDAAGLQPGRTYYYAFDSGGEQSPIGRTRTLPDAGLERLRLAVVSCANYPAGYFNVYRCLANREDIDLVVHLGDYIYEFANGVYGDGTALDRIPTPAAEAVTLTDYRQRYATYHTDADLQEAHRRHPFVAVWDDHEVANNQSAAGALGHTAAHGSYAVRRAGAYQAYMEWLPIRESPAPGIRLYRRFNCGGLADLIMLDTRGARDLQAPAGDTAAVNDPRRSMLGAEQERWLHTQLRDSQRAGTAWRLLGQQIVFAPLAVPGITGEGRDTWDGYPAARQRIFDMMASERLTDLAFLTGDIHSSWALDVRTPTGRYNARTGEGSLAIELITPAISSPPLFTAATAHSRGALIRRGLPHVRYLEGERRGYLILDLTRERLQADWYHLPAVLNRSPRDVKAATWVCERGSARLAPAP